MYITVDVVSKNVLKHKDVRNKLESGLTYVLLENILEG
jgi:hypothetical protein